MTNTNLKTGIRFGYISSNNLDSEVVHELMYGDQATDNSYCQALEEAEAEFHEDPSNEDKDFDFDFDDYANEEPDIEGVYEGVHYSTSWLGGALNFFIFMSPVIANCALCSPCVPGAGDLNNPGDYEAYGVPEGWKREVE